MLVAHDSTLILLVIQSFSRGTPEAAMALAMVGWLP